ncbi:hypothetical protein ACQ4PT_033717 [Festuca glaucescens]
MAGNCSFIRQPLRTKVVLDHTQEMTEEEAKLRESALVFTVTGSCPRLAPGHISDGLLHDFPDLPLGSFQISLLHQGNFFVRFSEPRWFQLVAAQPLFHCDGTPVLIRRWNRLTFASFSMYRYNVRLYLERLTPQAWSLATVQRALPACLIHTIAEETQGKLDLSYYIVDAWVDRLEDVPTEATIDIHEPRPCIDPLSHVQLPSGFSTPDPPVPGAGTPFSSCHREYLTTVPPRVLSTTILVHLDSSMFIRPAPASRKRWTSRDDDDFFDDDDDITRTDEEIHSWTHGVADDVWHCKPQEHRTLEAASSGAAARQHRPRPRNGGGRRRALTPVGFREVPLPVPQRAVPDAQATGAVGPNGALEEPTSTELATPCALSGTAADMQVVTEVLPMPVPVGLHGCDASAVNGWVGPGTPVPSPPAFGHATHHRDEESRGATLHGLPLSAMEGPEGLQRAAGPQEVVTFLSAGGSLACPSWRATQCSW